MNENLEERVENGAIHELAVDFGNAIREVLETRKPTSEFKGRISAALVSDVQNAKRAPSVAFIHKLSSALDINPHWISLLAAKDAGTIDPVLPLMLEEIKLRIRQLLRAKDVPWYPGTIQSFVADLGLFGVLFRDRDFALAYPHEILDPTTIELEDNEQLLVHTNTMTLLGRYQKDATKTKKHKDADEKDRLIRVALEAPHEGLIVEVGLRDVGLYRERPARVDATDWRQGDFVYARFPLGRRIESRLLWNAKNQTEK
jgi:hypothetical protein